jgi:hypothetical protein
MVLLNRTPDTVEADVHAVPTVHLSVDDAGRLRSYLRAAGREATARLDPAASERLGGPRLAPCSARGPGSTDDALKPDLTCPGVSVLGAVAPPADEGRLWSLRSGTSVATAHVAGLAAVMRSRHSAWSPARIRSALTTTADPLAGAPGPFAEGAGQVDPAEMLDPGVVLDAGPVGYRRFLHGALPAHELNTASVVVGDLVGTETVVRRLTNVSGSRGTYTATVSGLDGVQVSVQPRTVTLRPGQTRAVRIRLTATPDAPVREFTLGRITWTGLRHQARIPVLVRAAPVAAPSVVDADLDRGRVTVKGRSGTGTRVLPRTLGLAAASPLGISLQPRPFEDVAPPGPDASADASADADDGSDPGADPGAEPWAADGPAGEDTFSTSVLVPTGAEAARFEVTSHNAADDLDLRVFHGEELVGEATGPGPAAVVTLPEPQPGDYRVEVHAVRAGNGAVATGELTTWVVSRSGADELQVVARRQGDRPGAPFRYRVSWPELDPTQRWFAVLRYPGTDRRTYLRIG